MTTVPVCPGPVLLAIRIAFSTSIVLKAIFVPSGDQDGGVCTPALTSCCGEDPSALAVHRPAIAGSAHITQDRANANRLPSGDQDGPKSSIPAEPGIVNFDGVEPGLADTDQIPSKVLYNNVAPSGDHEIEPVG